MNYFTIDTENNITLHASAEEAEGIANCEAFSTSSDFAALAEKWPLSRLVEIWNSLPGASPVKKFTDRKSAVTRIWKAIQSLGEVSGAQESQPTNEPVAAQTAAQPQEPEAAQENIEATATNEPAIPESEAPAAREASSASDAQAASTELAEPVAEPATPFDEPEANVGAPAPDVAPTEPTPTKKATRTKKAPKAPAGEPTVPREGSKTSQLIAMLKREGGATLEEIMSTMGWLQHTTRAMLSAGGSLAKKHGLVVSSERVGDKRTYSIKA